MRAGQTFQNSSSLNHGSRLAKKLLMKKEKGTIAGSFFKNIRSAWNYPRATRLNSVTFRSPFTLFRKSATDLLLSFTKAWLSRVLSLKKAFSLPSAILAIISSGLPAILGSVLICSITIALSRSIVAAGTEASVNSNRVHSSDLHGDVSYLLQQQICSCQPVHRYGLHRGYKKLRNQHRCARTW